jgi:hypothetical protein
VALNADRLPKDADGDFFRALMKRWPQGLWVVTPEGKTLAFDYHTPDAAMNYQQNQQKWRDGTLAMVQEAMKAAGELKPREVRAFNPFPDRGLGLTQAGGVRLAVSVIGLRNGKQDGAPAVDSAILSKEEWSQFAPPMGQNEWTLPASAMKKWAVALSPLTDSIYVPRSQDMIQADAQAKVIREENGYTVIRLNGKWESKHLRDGNEKYPIRASATGDGVAVYNSQKREMESVLFVLKGTYQNGTTTTATALIVEWQKEKDRE